MIYQKTQPAAYAPLPPHTALLQPANPDLNFSTQRLRPRHGAHFPRVRIITTCSGCSISLTLSLRCCRMSSSPAASSDPRDRPSGDALLEEIDQTVPSSSTSAAAPASEAGSGSSPSNGSFVVVEEEASVSAKAEVVLEGEQAEQVKEAVERADEAVEEKTEEENKQDPPEEILV
jgi:hypothetical protein